eukprot:245999-Lingulodinium_polyedra.AAC.1
MAVGLRPLAEEPGNRDGLRGGVFEGPGHLVRVVDACLLVTPHRQIEVNVDALAEIDLDGVLVAAHLRTSTTRE